MSKLTKNQKIAYAKVEANKAYKLSEAAALRLISTCVWESIPARPIRWSAAL